tara:strand:+ start:91 stop:351 length:261 start_codon:yes stop_codon:yes gene_type:complete
MNTEKQLRNQRVQLKQQAAALRDKKDKITSLTAENLLLNITVNSQQDEITELAAELLSERKAHNQTIKYCYTAFISVLVIFGVILL